MTAKFVKVSPNALDWINANPMEFAVGAFAIFAIWTLRNAILDSLGG